jgi:hypothetical protein
MLDSIAVIALATAAAKLGASRSKTARCTPAELAGSASSQPASYKTSASGLSGRAEASVRRGPRSALRLTAQMDPAQRNDLPPASAS